MANSSKPTTTKTESPDLPTLQTSLSRLATAAHLLDGFVHRNKNQHRGTRWWAPFDMLRRSVRKLLPDLEGAVQRAELLSSSSTAPAKRKKTSDKEGAARAAVAAAKQPELDRVEVRAQWLHDVVAVKAFEAFTQLVADRQFAQLGLMLIGVLAQVEAALAPFAKPSRPEGEPEGGPGPESVQVAAGVAVTQDASVAPRKRDVDAQQEDDLGVAVSRDELGSGDDEEDDVAPIARRASPPPEHPPTKEKRPEKGEIKGKKRSRADDSSSSRIGRPEKLVRPESSRDEKKVKKKKKKKGGDEFDDLFSSLV